MILFRIQIRTKTSKCLLFSAVKETKRKVEESHFQNLMLLRALPNTYEDKLCIAQLEPMARNFPTLPRFSGARAMQSKESVTMTRAAVRAEAPQRRHKAIRASERDRLSTDAPLVDVCQLLLCNYLLLHIDDVDTHSLIYDA